MKYALPLLFVVLSVLAEESTPVREPQEFADYTVRFARDNGLEILRKGPLSVIEYRSPEDMAEKTGFPLRTPADELAVARVEMATGTIWLGRKGKDGIEDLYYEIAKYRFWPSTWMADQKKWRALADKFMRGWLDRSQAK
jgi:hypothetical protein